MDDVKVAAGAGSGVARAPSDIGPVLIPFPRGEMGGSHIAALTLARALSEDFGVRCVVMAVAGSLVASEALRQGLEVRELAERMPRRFRHTPLYDLVRLPARLAILRQYGRNSIVHCHEPGSLQSWLLPAKLQRLPVIYHHHGLFRFDLSKRLLVRSADAVVCVGRDCKASVGFVDADRVVTVLNPFALGPVGDRSSLRAQLLAEHGCRDEGPLIGYVGNFQQRKRPDFFLEVCALLAEREPRARFILFGRDANISRQELEAQARRLGIGERTIFAGFRLPSEANIASMDVILAPALREPFGRTLVEAIILGTPYVAAADGGHREIHERWGGGALVPLDATPAEYAARVLAAVIDPALYTLTPPRRAEIAEELSARRQAERMLVVFGGRKRAQPGSRTAP